MHLYVSCTAVCVELCIVLSGRWVNWQWVQHSKILTVTLSHQYHQGTTLTLGESSMSIAVHVEPCLMKWPRFWWFETYFKHLVPCSYHKILI